MATAIKGCPGELAGTPHRQVSWQTAQTAAIRIQMLSQDRKNSSMCPALDAAGSITTAWKGTKRRRTQSS